MSRSDGVPSKAVQEKIRELLNTNQTVNPAQPVESTESKLQHKVVCWLDQENHRWIVEMTESEPQKNGTEVFWAETMFVRFDHLDWRIPIGGGWDEIEDVKIAQRLEAIMQSTSDLNAYTWRESPA